MSLPRPIAGDWLGLRRTADSRAREASLYLVNRLRERLGAASGPVSVLDLGAGTGANQAWLAPRLGDDGSGGTGLDQHWTLLDHDPALLELAADVTHPRVLGTTRVRADLRDLPRLLAGAAAPRLVTCSAVLDLFTPSQVDQLCRSCLGTGSAALLALSVTGRVTVLPGHPDDDRVARAFNAHQQRAATGSGQAGGTRVAALSGPDGWRLAVSVFSAAGWQVHTAATDWDLGPDLAPMAGRFLADRVYAVLEFAADRDEESLAGTARSWLAARLAQLEDGDLRVRVEHRDVLAVAP
ncbi:MAG: class I SAM-dependent methyltransferase [Actinomycetota bacterium]|nr:class I SAM-dependent methyltransferase [Actinomycetota bacterium]